MRRRSFLASSGVALAALAGCSGREAPEQDSGGNGGGGEQEVTVEITDGAFEPKDVEIGVGGTVTWENTTDEDHQITSHRYQTEAANWDFPESPVEAGDSVEHTFDEEGLYQYYSITGGGQYSMCGSVAVGDVEASSECG